MTFDLLTVSGIALFIAFIFYVLSSIVYVVAITGRKMRALHAAPLGGYAEMTAVDPSEHSRRFGERGYLLTFLGFLFQLAFVVMRWVATGHSPTSNMFEFMSFLAFATIIVFLIIYRLYSVPLLGVFTLPVAVVLIAYASVFSTKAAPLIPALQSYWLYIHVTVAALGEGAFAVAFAAGLMYLILAVRQDKGNIENRLLEVTIYAVLSLIAFIVLTFAFRAAGHEVVFESIEKNAMTGMGQTTTYTLPAIVAPHGAEKVTAGGFGPFFEAPEWMRGVNAGRKLNTIIWSLLGGAVLYAFLRLVLRKRISQAAQETLKGSEIDLDMVDEISYRAVAIGFPIFTLGALVFAMIWAAEAWGRPWGWDPKETWALITWFFYAIYLHLRLSIGWQGKKSAWLAVLGFVIVMTNLVVVNLVLVGLHSYA
ncbi:MAG: c-type cytochrome biogenesis protein CcsB [Candidatus Carbobacillus altaicus]|uniref:Cytochrome c-type biogenesis protein CcsA/ResC n=1 Tax=Candidatus Carbonibacillus altaicus TaxID=2163959 RepID=A0A2R6XZN7_9BACL|nr:c-type cytochrome biogenesis protein CcsB [Candidatus Carbobacillus altaicus]PTQ55895.1 MAG: Cytochrome c-type biogenesis protein CcsA/ResC [Candidatus Carbobacillus altaicus]PTQ55957.1 MAG: Cytochrome c-type biogenesis protein CcsA/ResC [Candidatus Carbobacillus altaicus]